MFISYFGIFDVKWYFPCINHPWAFLDLMFDRVFKRIWCFHNVFSWVYFRAYHYDGVLFLKVRNMCCGESMLWFEYSIISMFTCFVCISTMLDLGWHRIILYMFRVDLAVNVICIVYRACTFWDFADVLTLCVCPICFVCPLDVYSGC